MAELICLCINAHCCFRIACSTDAFLEGNRSRGSADICRSYGLSWTPHRPSRHLSKLGKSWS